MEFYEGQIFEGIYPPEAARWCNESMAFHIEDIGEGRWQIARNSFNPPEPSPEMEEYVERQKKLSKLVESMTDETVPSDKLGQLWRITRLGEVEIMREYIPDPDAHGTADNPFEYAPGVQLFPNAYYLNEGIRYVYVNPVQRVATDWATDSADMEEF